VLTMGVAAAALFLFTVSDKRLLFESTFETNL
jgi:hypothetical protein